MAQTIDKIVKSKYPPKDKNVMWVDTSSNPPVQKVWDGTWKPMEVNENVDYENLDNLPKINSVVLTGDKSSEQLGLPKVYVVDDITTLDGDFLDNLHSGDVVVETDSTTGYSKTFVVTFYAEDDITRQKELYLNVLYSEVIESVTYGYIEISADNFVWEYQGRGYDDVAIKSNKTFIRTTQPQNGMDSNTLYNFGVLTTDTVFTMAAAYDNTIANIWTWTFSTGSTAPTITWPAQITMWSDGEAPEIEANKYYEVSVMNGVGTVISTDVPQEEETEVEP